ncbi:hypothetical protein VM94_04635 [Janthinobacterium sp. KBS0711]|uniref:DUF4286 family protein n=1 Tax=Janthinobacterium sp. KBS0711 TaxID=1649647 RepID=UPI000627ABE4|nr:DUF4286 family protein [Janthinobacterium sp. KBS0711]KKO62558.1 hypothetical protein VM94_04635 [Janthinobacterium sp. KBS0711]TSD70649.1 hypothetical protein FFI39_006285 [Janthinobacterium sp. KBS0711]
MTTSPTLPGILFVWTSADPEHERDFNRWYDREHVEERVRIPGFVSGTRYQSVRGPRKYLGLYRTVSLGAFQTPDYFKAFGQQTPWSLTNLQRMVDPMRRVCAIEAETGMGTGAWLAVLRLGAQAIGQDAQAVDAMATLGTKLLQIDGVIATRLLTPDANLSGPLPAERTEGRVLDPIFMIDASSESAAMAAANAACAALELDAEQAAILQLSWQLREADLRAA